jgi:ribosomal protein L40E
MVFIWGSGQQFRRIADVGIIKCRNCNNYSTFEIRELAKKFELYFIPVARWDKRYYLVCNACEAAYGLEKERMDTILSEVAGMPDNKTSQDIWNKMDVYIADLIRKGDFENWGDRVISEIKKLGFHEDEVKHVFSIYYQFLSESFSKNEDIVDVNVEEVKESDENENIFCMHCGTQLPTDAVFCKKCGKKQD